MKFRRTIIEYTKWQEPFNLQVMFKKDDVAYEMLLLSTIKEILDNEDSMWYMCRQKRQEHFAFPYLHRKLGTDIRNCFRWIYQLIMSEPKSHGNNIIYQGRHLI
jgi:hypothetical protein